MKLAWFVGVDWGSQTHQACVIDVAGTLLGERAFEHGLGQPPRAGVAAGEHDGQRLLRGGTGGGASDGHAEQFQHGPGGAIYKHGVHRSGPGGDGGVLDGRPAVDGA